MTQDRTTDDSHAVIEQVRAGRVLVIRLHAPPVNALSRRVRGALMAALQAAQADPATQAIVITGAGRGFSAGADIAEFDTGPQPPALRDICAVIAAGKPVLAALHGTVMGGGLELALACHGRMADVSARLALPEVTLGILPGAGGTQRLPRLIGADHALRMMLGGRAIDAAEALALGLVDDVVEGGLAEAAVAAALGLRPVVERREGLRDARGYQAAVAAARLAHASDRLPASRAIVDCVEAAQLLPLDQGLEFEQAAFADLVQTEEAAALRAAFFAERAMRHLPQAEAEATPRGVQRAAVIGAAGADQALLLLHAGLPVVLIDPDRPRLVAALERIAATQEAAVVAGRLTPPARDADWARLAPALDPGAAGQADIVLIADAALLEAAAAATRPGTVLMLLDKGPGLTGTRAADLLGLTLGPLGPRLAEVIVAPATAPDAVATAVALVRRLGRLALRVGAPGGVAARVMLVGQRAVAHLMDRGIAAGDIADALQDYGLTGLLQQAVTPTSCATPLAETIRARVLAAMANEGLRLLNQGVAARASDIDLALQHGFGLPRWKGGPMFWASQRGLMVLRRDLRDWAADAPELWAAAPNLDALVSTGGRLV